MKTLKAVQILGIYFCLALVGCTTNSTKHDDAGQSTHALDASLTPIAEIEAAFANRDSNVSVIVKGTITRILSDDTAGDQHQRFIIQLSNGQTLLIIHNIDIALRVAGIDVGSLVYVHGDYLWNSEGGFIHWTHHDPAGLHENGWIAFDGIKYD
jgi:hypothetical protein